MAEYTKSEAKKYCFLFCFFSRLNLPLKDLYSFTQTDCIVSLSSPPACPPARSPARHISGGGSGGGRLFFQLLLAETPPPQNLQGEKRPQRRRLLRSGDAARVSLTPRNLLGFGSQVASLLNVRSSRNQPLASCMTEAGGRC